jgi:uncharacterized protein YdiU (UPF0061 family)
VSQTLHIPFDNTYSQLPEAFYQKTSPFQAPKPTLIQFNKPLADELGISHKGATPEKLAEVFSGKTVPKGADPLAMAYAGHQFGHFVPQLGDGRALLLGEVLNKDGTRFDIQLKGSGQTAFSRRGDGRSPLGPAIREYIVSEAMHKLGVPTTRALALIATGEDVVRESVTPGAVFTRVAESHIRIGTFEYFSGNQDYESLKTLLNYTIERHYPDILKQERRVLSFLEHVVEAQALLIADWLGMGFIHGVMNTDNTSIIYQTIDYGPCAFMDSFERNKVYSSIDQFGRYAYSSQPRIAHWNLQVLAYALMPLIDESQHELALLKVEEFSERFEKAYLKKMFNKLGMQEFKKADSQLIGLWLNYLQEEKIDYTLSFRWLAEEANLQDSSPLPKTPAFSKFFGLWTAALSKQKTELTQAADFMNTINPVIIPRNHLIEKAIQLALKGEYSFFHELIEAVGEPYQTPKTNSELFRPPKPHEEVHETFCGT